MNNDLKAKEILEYCIIYLGNGEIPKNWEKQTKYKNMIEQIKFMLEND